MLFFFYGEWQIFALLLFYLYIQKHQSMQRVCITMQGELVSSADNDGQVERGHNPDKLKMISTRIWCDTRNTYYLIRPDMSFLQQIDLGCNLVCLCKLKCGSSHVPIPVFCRMKAIRQQSTIEVCVPLCELVMRPHTSRPVTCKGQKCIKCMHQYVNMQYLRGFSKLWCFHY